MHRVLDCYRVCASVMALTALPTPTELPTITTIDDARQWAGVAPAVRAAMKNHLGTVNSFRVVACVPANLWKKDLEDVRIAVPRPTGAAADAPPRECSGVLVMLCWSLAMFWCVSVMLCWCFGHVLVVSW